MAKVYITTPIYYVNDKPHLGHAYTSIAADVLARFHRDIGDEVFFLTGTDEHGAKIAQAAEKAGREPKEFVDELSEKFQGLTKVLNLSNDEFIRTTNPEHEKLVQEFLQKIYDAGYIYKKAYKGLYCVACEQFYTEKELVDGLCPVHKTKPVVQKEENWFFKLSEFQSQITKLIESDEILIRPETRKNEILGKLNLGLDDVSLSRASVEWGIKVPWDQSQTIYVWFDALLNYFTATKIYKKDFWPADWHIVGRDIAWFHTVIWPAMLLAAGEKLPKGVFVHGYFTVDGEKMSKTTGNVIDPVELVEKYGVDAVRYYVLRDFPFGEDGDVSLKRLEERYNSELASGLGNVTQRVLSMVKRYCVDCSLESVVGSNKDNKQQTTSYRQIEDLTKNLRFQEALSEIWKLIAELNKRIAEVEPWKLAKENKTAELNEFLQKCFVGVLEIADLVSPYLPATAQKIKSQAETLEISPIFEKI